jgi:glutathione S-transferase
MLRWFYPERYGDDDPVTAAAARDAAAAFDILDRALAGRTWLAAEHRTAADLFLFMVTRWGRRLDPPAWDRPNLRRHFLAALALPGVQRMIEEQGLELPSF